MGLTGGTSSGPRIERHAPPSLTRSHPCVGSHSASKIAAEIKCTRATKEGDSEGRRSPGFPPLKALKGPILIDQWSEQVYQRRVHVFLVPYDLPKLTHATLWGTISKLHRTSRQKKQRRTPHSGSWSDTKTIWDIKSHVFNLLFYVLRSHASHLQPQCQNPHSKVMRTLFLGVDHCLHLQILKPTMIQTREAVLRQLRVRCRPLIFRI